MEKFVMVSYPEPVSGPLKINYRIEQSGELQTIECVVDNKQSIPGWLQLQKFTLISLKTKDMYNLLFDQSKYNKNLDTVLFMDKVYAKIMRAGSFRFAS
ncbi:MAG TPA: hypothetical protein PKA53_11390 [Sphingobacterium sp.]|nr:hypothetical protein [Sphingobacterium sp.]